MNEEDLVKLACRAAGEPVGNADGESAELEHAVAVLRGATAEPSEHRNLELMELATDEKRMLHLWHFAAAAVVFFCIGLVVLFKVGFTPPEVRPPVVAQNTAGPSNDPGRASPANSPEQVPEQVYVRPEWIKQQATNVADTQAAEGSGAPGGLGGGPNGYGESSGGGDRGGGNPESGGQFGGSPGRAFKLFYPATPPKGMKLAESELLPAVETAAGFAMQRIEYSGPGRVLVLLEAAETGDSRRAMDAAGLEGNAVSVSRDGTVVLLISNSLSESELRDIAGKLIETP